MEVGYNWADALFGATGGRKPGGVQPGPAPSGGPSPGEDKI